MVLWWDRGGFAVGKNRRRGGGLSGGLRKSAVGIKIAPPAGDF